MSRTWLTEALMRSMEKSMAEASVDKIIELPKLPPRTLDRVALASHCVQEGVRSEYNGVVCGVLADADVDVIRKYKAQLVIHVGADSLLLVHCLSREKCSAAARHIERVAQLTQRFLGRVFAVAIANITCGNAQDNGADEFDGQSDTVSNVDAHVRVALRDAVGREEATVVA
eukprot:846837-Pleurochrysis_carterae.AAC.2